MSELTAGSIWYRTMKWVYNSTVLTSHAQQDLRRIGYKKYDDEGNNDNSVTVDEVLTYCDNHEVPKGNDRLELLGKFFTIAGPDLAITPYEAHNEEKRLSDEFETIFTIGGKKYNVFAFCNKSGLMGALLSLKLYRVGHSIVIGNQVMFNYREQSISDATRKYYLPSKKARDILERTIQGLVCNINGSNVFPANEPYSKKNKNRSVPLDAFEKSLFKQRLIKFLSRYLNP